MRRRRKPLRTSDEAVMKTPERWVHSYRDANVLVPERAVAEHQEQADQSGLNQSHVVVKLRSWSVFTI